LHIDNKFHFKQLRKAKEIFRCSFKWGKYDFINITKF